jgi:hypothetical protein
MISFSMMGKFRLCGDANKRAPRQQLRRAAGQPCSSMTARLRRDISMRVTDSIAPGQRAVLAAHNESESWLECSDEFSALLRRYREAAARIVKASNVQPQ